FRKVCETCCEALDRLAYQRGCDSNDMSGSLNTHLRYGELRHIEETQETRPDRLADVLRSVVTERLGNKDARIITQAIDPTEFLNCGRNDLPGRFGMAYIAVHEL